MGFLAASRIPAVSAGVGVAGSAAASNRLVMAIAIAAAHRRTLAVDMGSGLISLRKYL
jgi:hypothetical protein